MKQIFKIAYILIFLFSEIYVFAETENIKDEIKNDKWSFINEDTAKVNGVNISKKDLISFIELTSDPNYLQSLTGKELKSYSREILERLINQTILAQIAAAEDFVPGFDLIKKETETMMGKMTEEDKKRFLDYLNFQKMNIDDFCKSKAENKFESRQFAIDTWFENKIKPKIELTDKEIKDFYDKAGDMVGVSQILIKYDGNSSDAKAHAKKEAEEILKKLKEGEDCHVLAKTKSQCNSNYNGIPGAMKPFPRGEMVQEFEDAAFSLDVGKVSDVIETPFGYHIIKVDSKSKRHLPPFEDVKEQIKEELLAIKGQDIIISKLNKAKKHWVIEVPAFK